MPPEELKFAVPTSEYLFVMSMYPSAAVLFLGNSFLHQLIAVKRDTGVRCM